jgi:nucleoid-associated protein YejK
VKEGRNYHTVISVKVHEKISDFFMLFASGKRASSVSQRQQTNAV